MEIQKQIKELLGLKIVETDFGNIAVVKGKKPLQFFRGEHAVEEAEEYIMKLHQLGEI